MGTLRTAARTDCEAPEGSLIVRVDRFIRATRDSGYRGTGSAVAELVDNALQAKARTIHIALTKCADRTDPITLSVMDDGQGMNAGTLRQALRFGGSTRFEDRSGLGRYGMGLPNSSLSQARRVDVFTWSGQGRPLHSFLDVDEIAAGDMREVPQPRRSKLPGGVEALGPSGTLVVWSKCDRLDNRRVSTISRKLSVSLGRIFRHYLWGGVRLLINGHEVAPVDPLFLHEVSVTTGARLFGEPLEYEIENTDRVAGSRIGRVSVRFSELPIHEWHALSNAEKRTRGITKGAGVSIVRAGREIDYGWLFMGAKRKENYDVWWRCEVHFDPALDEAFGITHTKQGIRPRPYLVEALSPDIEATARALNSRARRAHSAIRRRARACAAEEVARRIDGKLAPLQKPIATLDSSLEELKHVLPALRGVASGGARGSTWYTIRAIRRQPTTNIYDFIFEPGTFALLLNEEHPFFKRLCAPLAESDEARDRLLYEQLQLLFVAAARAEATCTKKPERAALRRFRSRWSEALGLFLNAHGDR